MGFSTFRDRDNAAPRNRKSRKSNGSIGTVMDEDSDESDDDSDQILGKMEDVNDKVKDHLSPEDARFTGELADGVDRIRVR